jgi:hypothetical protein
VSGDILVRCLELLFGFSLLLQVAEYLRIAQHSDPQGIWAWQIQRGDIPAQPPWVRRFFDLAFQPAIYRVQLWVRGLAALALMVWGASLPLAMVLFVGNLLLLVRWRGAFNGGSDFMTLITVTGLLIAQGVTLVSDEQTGWSAGRGYIAIQTLSSYFVSGWIKLKRPEWRNGQALTVFLNSGLHGPLSPDSVFRRPFVARVCSWAFIVWEGLFPLVLIHPPWIGGFVALALLFHFLVFWFFGLNRFFWAWATNLSSLFFLGHYFSSAL